MALNCYSLLVLLALSAPLAILASDPDIMVDYIAPASTNRTNITGDFFTYTGFSNIYKHAGVWFHLDQGHYDGVPPLNGQSVSYAMLAFPPGSVNPTHTHPRASELLVVVHGTLSVGFIDTANKLYTQDLGPGDMFVFPKGTVHYQFNQGNSTATALSAFGSATPGLVSVPLAAFDTGIDNAILAKSFRTDEATIKKLKAGLAFRCC